MKRCIRRLVKVGQGTQCRIVIDGNHRFGLDIQWEVATIIQGDQKVPAISMASIIAKVERDRFMLGQSLRYPVYGFAQHK